MIQQIRLCLPVIQRNIIPFTGLVFPSFHSHSELCAIKGRELVFLPVRFDIFQQSFSQQPLGDIGRLQLFAAVIINHLIDPLGDFRNGYQT